MKQCRTRNLDADECIPNADECTPNADECIPNADECIPNADKCNPNAVHPVQQTMRMAGEFLGPLITT